MTPRTLSPSAYFLPAGSLLTPAEAAHLITREAAGEQLPSIPKRTPAGYILTPRTALTLAELEQHTRRVTAFRDFLEPYQRPALPA